MKIGDDLKRIMFEKALGFTNLFVLNYNSRDSLSVRSEDGELGGSGGLVDRSDKTH